MFDAKKFKAITAENERYPKRLNSLRQNNIKTDCIEKAIDGATTNLSAGMKSFVVYGEPQCGKTEMMIALTAKLLDDGAKIIIILLNDNVELLKQNLNRFRRAGLSPDPKNFTEVIDSNVEIGNSEWVVFCKKNSSDLRKLIEKLGKKTAKILIDDEADYATPNGKVNRGEKTRINGLIEELLGKDGIYIGVTATPARLDLNNTYDNVNDCWVWFPPHENYTGQTIFFPSDLSEEFKYRLRLMPDDYDSIEYLREAVFSFLITVSYLNSVLSENEKNYSMLVHTSGHRVDHTTDYKQIVELINSIKDSTNRNFEKYLKRIWEMAKKRFNESAADKIVDYICRNISRHTIVIMNSPTGNDKKSVDYAFATDPVSPFTFAIGGNIISRGVTFSNLLSMFFTRDVRHKIQQDTYIQRARMFGARNPYLQYFELFIPESLYMDWHRCFVFHRLATQSIRSGNGSPVWLEDHRIAAASKASIDKATVGVHSGEMSFGLFEKDEKTESIISLAYDGKLKPVTALRQIYEHLGDLKLPLFLIEFLERFSPQGDRSIAVHFSSSVDGYNDADKDLIKRSKGLMGASALEEQKFPNAIHHIKIFYNSKNKARVFYKYAGNIKFIKNWGKYSQGK